MLRHRDILLIACSFLLGFVPDVSAEPTVQLRQGQTFAGRIQVPTDSQQQFALDKMLALLAKRVRVST